MREKKLDAIDYGVAFFDTGLYSLGICDFGAVRGGECVMRKDRKGKTESPTYNPQWIEKAERDLKIEETLLAIHTVVGVLMIAVAIFRAVQGG